MPQEESKRGAHFAKGPTLSASSPELASVEQEIRKAWSAATDPGETAVYLRAAGAGSVPSRSPLSSTRPDETAVFLAAARAGVDRASSTLDTPHAPRPDETAVFLMAAQGKSSHQGAAAVSPATQDAPDDGEPLLSDDEWSPLGSVDLVEGVTVDDDDDWVPCRFLVEVLPRRKSIRCLGIMPRLATMRS